MNDFENEKNAEDTEQKIKSEDESGKDDASELVSEEKNERENEPCLAPEQNAEKDADGGEAECAEAEALRNGKEREDRERSCKEGKEKGHCHRELQKAREEIEKLKAEGEELKRKWYSVTAEYENYRRRTQNQAAQKYAEGRSDVVAALFPIGDNLERALAACADEKTREGVEMILKSYKKLLENEKVEELDPTGQPFDSAVAEAIMAVPAAEGEEAGVVKQVYVKGYKRGDKVLRYAQVIVTQ